MTTGLVDRKRLIFPGLGKLYESLAPGSYSFMRFAAGAVLLPHGIQKVFFVPNAVATYSGYIAKAGLPLPEVLAYLTLFTESVGALCLAVGLFTRLAALSIFIEMAVIVTVFQWQYGYFWTVKGYEYALLWCLLCLAIFFRGGGRYSLDRLLGKEF
jgi:putative oxidoreductase